MLSVILAWCLVSIAILISFAMGAMGNIYHCIGWAVGAVLLISRAVRMAEKHQGSKPPR